MANVLLLTNLLDQRRSQYGHFLLEACLERTATTASYDNLFAKVTAVKAGETKPIQAPLDFGSHVFAARRLELDELQPLIEQPNPTFSIGCYSFTFANPQLSRSFYQERLSSNNDWSDWPIDLLELRSMGGGNYISPRTLVSHNTRRVFRDVYDGIEQYTGDKISYNSGWLRALLLVLPDYRVRISEVAYDNKQLILRLMRDEKLVDLRVHGLIDGLGRQEISEQINGSEANFRLQSEISQVESLQLFITAPEGTLDYYHQSPLHHSGRFRWIAGPQQRESQKNDDLLVEIKNGEGVNLEFKPFVHLGKSDEKFAEVIRTVIAFSNTAGGTILFGVRNTGEIDGIENELRHRAKTADVVSAADEYGRHIKTMLNDAIATNVRLDIRAQAVEIAGHTLLRIDVQELPFENKPAWKADSKETWIRRGATNFRPDPEMIRDGFARKQTGAQILGLGQPGIES